MDGLGLEYEIEACERAGFTFEIKAKFGPVTRERGGWVAPFFPFVFYASEEQRQLLEGHEELQVAVAVYRPADDLPVAFVGTDEESALAAAIEYLVPYMKQHHEGRE